MFLSSKSLVHLPSQCNHSIYIGNNRQTKNRNHRKTLNIITTTTKPWNMSLLQHAIIGKITKLKIELRIKIVKVFFTNIQDDHRIEHLTTLLFQLCPVWFSHFLPHLFYNSAHLYADLIVYFNLQKEEIYGIFMNL